MKRYIALTLAALLPLFPLAASAQANPEALMQRLQTLEDKEQIRTLLLDYGRHLDARDWDAFAALFAADGGAWNGGMGIARGQDEIRAMMINTIGLDNTGSGASGVSNLHWLGNEFIEVDGDSAKAISKWIFFMTAPNGGPNAVFIGHYADTLIRTSGQWRFRERVVHGDIMSPMTIGELNSEAARGTSP